MGKTITPRATRGSRLSSQTHGQRLLRDARDVLRHAEASRRPVIQQAAAEMVIAAATIARLQSDRFGGRP